jgi:hypothetical protein
MSSETWSKWPAMWEATLTACRGKGGVTHDLVIHPSATATEISKIENDLEMTLPPDLRRVFLEFSSGVSFYWSLPEEAALPTGLEEVLWGWCEWGLGEVFTGERERRDVYIASPVTEETEGLRVWKDKVCFHPIVNGDWLALDLSFEPPPVVYLSHEYSEAHGQFLGSSFVDFMDRWTRLGCPGPEEWVLSAFLEPGGGGLEPDSPKGGEWLEWLGLKCPR